MEELKILVGRFEMCPLVWLPGLSPAPWDSAPEEWKFGGGGR